jgi:hypothetical protein
MSQYRINLYVLNNQGQVVEDTILKMDLPNQITARTLKMLLNNEKYPDPLSEHLTAGPKSFNDGDKVAAPFLTYTIKLK